MRRKKIALLARLIMVALILCNPCNSKAQLSKQLIDILPDSSKPVPPTKKNLTVFEKMNILKYADIHSATPAVLKELDSIATDLEKDTAGVDIQRKFNLENVLVAYATRTGQFSRCLIYCDRIIQMFEGKKEYISLLGKWKGIKGITLSRLGNYEESIQYLNTVLEQAKANKDSLAIASAYFGLSSPEFFLEFPEKVVVVLDSCRAYYGEKAIGNKNFSSYYSEYIISFQYMGYLLMYEKTDSSKYIDKMNSIIKYCTKNNLTPTLAQTFPAISAYANGEYSRTGLTCDSILATTNLNDLVTANQYKIIILQKYKALSLYKLGQMQQAIIQMKKCIETCQDFDKIDTTRGFTKYTVDKLSHLLYEYYSQKEDWQQAYYFLSLNNITSQKIDVLRNRGKAFEATQKYNLTKADAEINQLAIDNLVRKKEKNIAVTTTIASMLSFVVILLLLVNRNRKLQLKKQLAEHDAQNRIAKLNMASQMQIAELEEKAHLVKIEERKRLGLELHDNLAASLAAIKIQVSTEAQKINDEQIRSKLNSIAEQLSNAYEITRSKSHEWYILSNQNDDSSFSKKIQIMIENVLPGDIYQKEITIENNALEKISLTTKINILRIIQETITNILKHANAKTVSLLIYEEVKDIVLKVADDGKGFNYHADMKTGIGLLSIKERVEDIKGNLKIISGHNGTEITILIPIMM